MELLNREILFRGRKIDNGKLKGQFVYGGYTEWGNTQSVITEKGKYLENHNHEVDPATVGQYTGKIDKNCVKIFDSDIVKTKYGRICVVTWFGVQWDLYPVETDENLKNPAPDDWDLWYSENLEVVGNVHDNPDLLEGTL